MPTNEAKPFKDLSEQIVKLREKGIGISDVEEAEVKKILLKENYYSVVNGYKFPFLRRNIQGQIVRPEEFITNTTFKDIYNMFLFDRDLRNIFLKYLLEFESQLKALCAYHFSETYTQTYSYLTVNSYNSDVTKLKDVLGTISILANEIKKQSSRNNTAINHYTNKHNCVPLWVLINFLTLGNVSYFYSSCTQDVQTKIAKGFSKQHKENYSGVEKIDVKELEDIIKFINLFRNVCAHGEVLFIYKVHHSMTYDSFYKFFDFENESEANKKIGDKNIYTLLLLLKLVLDKETYSDLLAEIENLFEETRQKSGAVDFDSVLEIMGFPTENWKEKLFKKIS